jgi:hypothetical protein
VQLEEIEIDKSKRDHTESLLEIGSQCELGQERSNSISKKKWLGIEIDTTGQRVQF